MKKPNSRDHKDPNHPDRRDEVFENQKKLSKIQRELMKVRGKEYELPFGSMARARASRKWDELAKEQFKLQMQIDEGVSCPNATNEGKKD